MTNTAHATRTTRLFEGINKARDGETYQQLWGLYGSHRSLLVYAELARNPHTPADLLERLADVTNYSARITKIRADRCQDLRYLTADEIQALKKVRGTRFTQGYVYVPYLKTPMVKDMFSVLLHLAQNPNTTEEALRTVHNTNGLWNMTPRRSDVSITSQMTLLKALRRHANRPPFLEERLEHLTVERITLQNERADIRASRKFFAVATLNTHSVPQTAIVKPEAPLDFDAQMEAEWAEAFA